MFDLSGMAGIPQQTPGYGPGDMGQGMTPQWSQPDPNATVMVPGQQKPVPGQTMQQALAQALMKSSNSQPFQAAVMTAYGNAPNLMQGR